MKKFLILPLFFALTAAAAGVTELNNEIVKLLAPFQNQSTVAELKFTKAESNAERALSLAVGALYRKVGPLNTLLVDIQNISYEYGDGSAPTTNVQAAVGADLTAFVPQEDLNQIIPSIEQVIEQGAGSLIGEFGEAVTLKTEITDRTQDEAGNYTGIKGNISFSIDFAKLPEGKNKEEIIVKSGSASITVNVKTGLTLNAQFVSNTDYKGFQADNEGLKELIDQFLAQDPELMADILDLFQKLEQMANQIVNGQQ